MKLAVVTDITGLFLDMAAARANVSEHYLLLALDDVPLAVFDRTLVIVTTKHCPRAAARVGLRDLGGDHFALTEQGKTMAEPHSAPEALPTPLATRVLPGVATSLAAPRQALA